MKLLLARLRVRLDGLLSWAGLTPSQGYARNPMLEYPRNLRCFCGTGVKYKHCCFSKQSKYIPAAMASDLAGYITHVKLAEGTGLHTA